MQGDAAERWRTLCEEAEVEHDHDRLIMLIREINGLLDEKEARLNATRTKKGDTPTNKNMKESVMQAPTPCEHMSEGGSYIIPTQIADAANNFGSNLVCFRDMGELTSGSRLPRGRECSMVYRRSEMSPLEFCQAHSRRFQPAYFYLWHVLLDRGCFPAPRG